MMLFSTLGEMLAMSDMKKEEVAEQISPEAMNKLGSNETIIGVPSNCAVDDGEGEGSPGKFPS
jgi:hypothetical protein